MAAGFMHYSVNYDGKKKKDDRPSCINSLNLNNYKNWSNPKPKHHLDFFKKKN
jgi:hypothetical protein